MKNYKNVMRYAATAFGRGVRVMAAFDIAKARTRCEELRGAIATARTQLAEHVQAGTGTAEELGNLRNTIAHDVQEYNDLMGALETNEQQIAAGVAAQFNRRAAGRAEAFRDAMGGYFRAAMTGLALPAAVVAALSVPMTVGQNPGNGLLPVTVSSELIGDIYDDDSLLAAITVTQIPGLRLPKATTEKTVTDEALESGATATEHTMTDDVLTFGRFPARDVIAVPSSVLRGTNTDLAGYIEGKLQEIHRERMYRRMLSTTASGNYAHMSVYNAAVGVKKVTGATLYDAITAALAALPLAARRVAKVLMAPTDYYAMIKELAGGAQALFGAAAQEILGFEVVLCEGVGNPVVGDLKTIHVNYDDVLGMDVDKVVRTGVTDTVLYGDYDIQIEDANRLRLAAVA